MRLVLDSSLGLCPLLYNWKIFQSSLDVEQLYTLLNSLELRAQTEAFTTLAFNGSFSFHFCSSSLPMLGLWHLQWWWCMGCTLFQLDLMVHIFKKCLHSTFLKIVLCTIKNGRLLLDNTNSNLCHVLFFKTGRSFF